MCYPEGLRKHIHLAPKASAFDQKLSRGKSLFHRVLDRRAVAIHILVGQQREMRERNHAATYKVVDICLRRRHRDRSRLVHSDCK